MLETYAKKRDCKIVNSLFFCDNKAGNILCMQRGISDESRSFTAIRTD